MATSTPHHAFSYSDYLEREKETGFKHEFLNGQIFSMAGGTPEHARLIAEVGFVLRGIIDPTDCRVFSSDLKIRVAASGLTTYPDLAVICGDLMPDAEDPNAVTNPTVLVEVLSPSTEAYDRGEKWAHYRRIPSLRAYVLVGQIPPRIETYERDSNGEFVHRVAGPGEALPLGCLSGEIAVDPLYASAL